MKSLVLAVVSFVSFSAVAVMPGPFVPPWEERLPKMRPDVQQVAMMPDDLKVVGFACDGDIPVKGSLLLNADGTLNALNLGRLAMTPTFSPKLYRVDTVYRVDGLLPSNEDVSPTFEAQDTVDMEIQPTEDAGKFRMMLAGTNSQGDFEEISGVCDWSDPSQSLFQKVK